MARKPHAADDPDIFIKKLISKKMIPNGCEDIVKAAILSGIQRPVIEHAAELYKDHQADDETFMAMLDNLQYVVDLGSLKEMFMVKEKPAEEKKDFGMPSALYGAVYGDIAGSCWESEFNKQKMSALTPENCIKKQSHPTDDSILSCATAAALLEPLEYDNSSLIPPDYACNNSKPFVNNPYTKKYKEYGNRQFTDPGWGCAFGSWLYSEDISPYGSMGNGSAMRVSPIPEYFESQEDVIIHSAASAAATHNHIEGVAGAIVTAMCIWMAKNGYSKEQIFTYMKKYYTPEHILNHVKYAKVFKDYSMDELRAWIGPCICPWSVPAAVICFYHSSDFKDTMQNVLSFVGDTDTIGAISCSIAGAFYGIPSDIKGIVDERKPPEIFDEAIEILMKKS